MRGTDIGQLHPYALSIACVCVLYGQSGAVVRFQWFYISSRSISAAIFVRVRV